MAFPTSQPWGLTPAGVAQASPRSASNSRELLQGPLQPTNPGVCPITKATTDGNSATPDFLLEVRCLLISTGSAVLVYSYRQPSLALCTGTSFHSPLPGSGWWHCDVTPNTEKGTAHLPCYQNNTLTDNCWIAFKQCCLHTSKNTLDYGFIVMPQLHPLSPAGSGGKLRHTAHQMPSLRWPSAPRDRLATVVALRQGGGPGHPTIFTCITRLL